MNPSETNQQMNEQDTVGKAIKRNLSPKKALDLARHPLPYNPRCGSDRPRDFVSR